MTTAIKIAIIYLEQNFHQMTQTDLHYDTAKLPNGINVNLQTSFFAFSRADDVNKLLTLVILVFSCGLCGLNVYLTHVLFGK